MVVKEKAVDIGEEVGVGGGGMGREVVLHEALAVVAVALEGGWWRGGEEGVNGGLIGGRGEGFNGGLGVKGGIEECGGILVEAGGKEGPRLNNALAVEVVCEGGKGGGKGVNGGGMEGEGAFGRDDLPTGKAHLPELKEGKVGVEALEGALEVAGACFTAIDVNDEESVGAEGVGIAKEIVIGKEAGVGGIKAWRGLDPNGVVCFKEGMFAGGYWRDGGGDRRIPRTSRCGAGTRLTEQMGAFGYATDCAL